MQYILRFFDVFAYSRLSTEDAQYDPKRAPRVPQEAPRGAQERPTGAQEEPFFAWLLRGVQHREVWFGGVHLIGHDSIKAHLH